MKQGNSSWTRSAQKRGGNSGAGDAEHEPCAMREH